jgi:hypothetical protein
MKAITITILAVTLAVGAGKAWARCTDADKQACACPIRSQNTQACQEQDQVNRDYAVEQAARAEVGTMTTATPLDVQADCDSANTVGQGICGVTLWLHPTTNSDGYHCTVSYEMDGWGSFTVTNVECGANNG